MADTRMRQRLESRKRGSQVPAGGRLNASINREVPDKRQAVIYAAFLAPAMTNTPLHVRGSDLACAMQESRLRDIRLGNRSASLIFA